MMLNLFELLSDKATEIKIKQGQIEILEGDIKKIREQALKEFKKIWFEPEYYEAIDFTEFHGAESPTQKMETFGEPNFSAQMSWQRESEERIVKKFNEAVRVNDSGFLRGIHFCTGCFATEFLAGSRLALEAVQNGKVVEIQDTHKGTSLVFTRFGVFKYKTKGLKSVE